MTGKSALQLKVLPYELTVCQAASLEDIRLSSDFFFIGRTDEELSLVCRTEDVPDHTQSREDGWRAFRVEGVLEFSLTGILSGTADAMTLKTARLALSTGIPVLGGILSDAAGAVLTAARLIRNALGAFGILAVTAAALLPLARIGVRYLLFRFAAALSALSGDPALIRFVDSAADAMGLLLGLCGTCMLLLLLAILACMTLGGFV